MSDISDTYQTIQYSSKKKEKPDSILKQFFRPRRFSTDAPKVDYLQEYDSQAANLRFNPLTHSYLRIKT